MDFGPALSDPERLQALASYGVMDTPAEADFDDVAAVAARVCGTTGAFVTFVDDRRQFFKVVVGGDGTEQMRHATLATGHCPRTVAAAQAGASGPVIVVESDGERDGAAAAGGVRFYAGTPLATASGQVIGTLCVVDREPRQLSADQLSSLEALGRQVVRLLELRRELGDRRTIETALRSSEQRYRQLFDTMDEGFCTIRVRFADDGRGGQRAVDYRFDQVNPAFEQHTGLVGAAGRWMRDLAPDLESQWYDAYGRVALTGEPARFELEASALGRRFDVYAIRIGDPAERCVAIVFTNVTARRAAEEALRSERELLRTVFDQAPDDAILVMDPDRVLAAWNPAAERITGWTAAEAIGQTADIIFTPEDRAAGGAGQETDRAAADGKAADERWHVRKDGSRFWGSGTMNALHHPDGSVRGFLKVFRDATARHVEAETLAFQRRLDDELLDHPDPERVVDLVTRRLGEHLGASRVLITEASADGQSVTVERGWAVPGMRELAGTYFLADFGQRIAADYAGGRTHVRRDTDREYPPGPERDNVRAVQAMASIDVPVRIDGRLRFVLVVHQATARDWTDAEITLCQQVADRAAAGVEQTRAARAVAESEARLSLALDAARLGTFDWNVTTGALRLDGRARTIFGVGPDELIDADGLFGRVHPDDLPGLKLRIAADVEKAGPIAADYRIVHPAEPAVRVIRSTGLPLGAAAGQSLRYVGVFEDVTDARAAADALRATEAQSRFLADLTDVGRTTTDPDAVLAATVDRLLDHLGADRCAYAEADPDGDGITVRYERLDPGGSNRSLAGRFRLADFGRPMLENLRAGRTVAVCDAAADPRVSAATMAAVGVAAVLNVPVVKDGRLVAVLAAHDLRPRAWSAADVRLAEAAAERSWAEVERARSARDVAESEARFRQLADAMPQIVWAARPDGAVYYYNQQWYDYTGMPRGMEGHESWNTVIHPDDLPMALAASAEASRTGRPLEIEARYRRGSDAAYRWFLARARPVLDEQGQIVRWFGTNTDTHDRKLAAEAARQGELRLAAALDVADLGTFDWDVQTDAVAMDARSRGLFGFAADDPMTAPEVSARMDPADVDGVRATVDAALASETTRLDLEYGVCRPGGLPDLKVQSLAHIARGSDGRPARVFGVFADVTERRRAEAELAFQRHQLELMFRDSPAAMALWTGADLVFERVNPQYQDWFRGRPLVGLPLLEAVPELRGQGFDELLRGVLDTGNPIVGREVLARFARTADGPVEDRYFDYTYLQVRDPDGRPWGVYDHAVDVTDRVVGRQALERSEAQLREALVDRQSLLDSERAARTEAELAGRMKDEFLATLSHELRTPLNAIVGWTQILRGDPGLSTEVADGLAVIDRNARAQTQIIEDILDMSRIISGKVRLDVQAVDLAAVVRAGADTVRPGADAKGVQLQVVVDPLAATVSGDPGRLHQVFWNLVSNAVKFTPKGGRVQVRLERVNSHIEASVVDTGEGIDAAFLPYVFDRFRQADASTTRRHGGLGLGLAIVKQLVELHGGSVRVKSPGKGYGSTFVVALPLAVVHPGPADDQTVREHPRANGPVAGDPLACEQLRGVNMLVVDDEADGRAVVKRLLEDCGAVVRTAGSAEQAVVLMTEAVPEVLVSDIGMPVEDGYGLIRRVRSMQADRGGRVPAVALTAYARAADRIKAMEAGFQMHLSKPVEPAELVATVAALARQARHSAG